MNFTCLSKGKGFHFPPCYILELNGYKILLDCPLDLSAMAIFAPVPSDFCPVFLGEKDTECSESLAKDDSMDIDLEIHKRPRIEKQLDVKSLIQAEPWYKTVKNLHLWDPSSIDVVLITSDMGMLGLPFISQTKGFSGKIYATEATARLGKLIMEDLVSMHMEFRQFYGFPESHPDWMKWKELEVLPNELKEVVIGKDGSELGAWLPLYSSGDVKDCLQKIQTLKYAEAACYNGALVIKAFSSGLEVGSCNWSIQGLKANITCLSSSIFASTHSMEFDYHALRGNDLIIYSDFSSQSMMEDTELPENYNSSTILSSLNLSSGEENWKELNDYLLNNDEISEESDKLAFICSCVVESVKAGGSVLITLSRLGIILQLLEQIPVALESSAVKVPMYVISSVAAELLEFANIIPEWLCKLRIEKLFSGEPLFSHVELVKEKKLHVFPALHSPDLITNWQEPCVIFASHWNLRLGPVVPLLRRWHGDPKSLLILEDGLDAAMALLPFEPIAMKILNCSFLSGIRIPKVQPLLKVLQPKIVAFPKDLKWHLNGLKSSAESFSVLCYAENEKQDIQSLQDGSDLEIATDLATRLYWRNLKRDDIDVARLDGELFIEDGKHRLVSCKNASQSRQLLHWDQLDMEKLLDILSKAGINGSIEQKMIKEDESNTIGIIKIYDPNEALIEVGATRTIINAQDDNLATIIFDAIRSLLEVI